MHNRGQIKWQAFESLYKTKEVKEDLVNKKNYARMPDLSPDQYNELEETLKCAYARNSAILLTFYCYPKFYQIMDKIKMIDNSLKKIYLKNSKVISMYQIVKIKIK